jgi:hypothetical protein
VDENQVRHTFRHTDQLGLDRDAVSNAIRADLARQGPASPGANVTGNISVSGVTIEYRAFGLADGLSMSVESRVLEMSAWRKLRKEEVDLITAMARHSSKSNEVLRSLSDRLVEDMKDGGMGSLRFKDADNRERHLERRSPKRSLQMKTASRSARF